MTEQVVENKREVLLEVNDLDVRFETRRSVVRAVDGVNLTIYKGERFGLAGESGSGKTTFLLSLLRMIKKPGYIAGGQAVLDDGTDLLALNPEQIRDMRIKRLAMVPQGAMNSLNPVMRVVDQMMLTMREHGEIGDKATLLERVAELLKSVGLDRDVGKYYPHELSGGMKQRVCIALAICLNPQLILADEPTSALDVVVQRQIMQTLRRLQVKLDASVLLVGHDMGLMAQFAERIGIMYQGKLVEVDRVENIFHDPQHPYTQKLISSLPSFERKNKLETLSNVLDQPPA